MSDALVQELADDIALGRDVRSVAGQVDDLAHAYNIQDLLRPHLGVVCGRKIAANAPALMDTAELGAPFFGVITGQAALSPGSVLRLSEYAQLALEPEFAAVIGRDIPAGTILTSRTLPDYVDRFSLAFEVLDRRNDAHSMHGPTFVANNIFNAGVVLDEAALDMNALNEGTYSATFTAVDTDMVSGESTAPQNPLEACTLVINHFSARGEAVQSGEVILCGAHHPPMVIRAEGKYVFRLSSGEEVSLSISS